MSEWSIYVFPKHADAQPGFCERVVGALAQAGVIEPSQKPLENFDDLSAGDSVADFLVNGFDYLGVRKGKNPRLIPEDPAVVPLCPKCRTDLSERWYEIVNDESDRDEEQDWTKPRVACGKCGWRGALTDVADADGVGAFARREFIFLSDVTPESDAELERLKSRFKQLLGDDVEVVSYNFT